MKSPEVLVIGAGPGGCVAAIEHAKRGHEVWLCEAKPKAAERRLAGEWLHNTGRLLLESLDIDLTESHRGEGFVVHPGDESEGIVLPYVQPDPQGPLARWLLPENSLPAAAEGLSWEHADLVEQLRARALAQPGVNVLEHARVHLDDASDPGDPQVRVVLAGRERIVHPDRIVDATGKACVGRRALGLADDFEPATVSRMIGLELLDCEVPLVDYGHVFLGSPGPMLMYRIRPHSVRIIVDVPRWYADGRKPTNEELLRDWASQLPTDLRRAFQRALIDSRPKWTNVAVRIRSCYGLGRVALVGDAVGHYHPLTAAGMTNALLDAQALARHDDVDGYARERTRTSKSAGLLGVALYDMFARPEPEVHRMRQALYERWRSDAVERRRTMGYLGMGDQRVTAFMSSFLKVVGGGFAGGSSGQRVQAWRQSARFIGARAPWLVKSFGARTAAGPVMVPGHAN